MNTFHSRQTNILCLYIISLSASLSSLCSDSTLCLPDGRPDALRASGSASNPAGGLMTSSVITLPLLLTPALKNNIYPVCHHHMVGMCLPAFASDLNDDFHSPLVSGVLLRRERTRPVRVKRIFLRKSGSGEPNISAEPKPPRSLIIFQLGAA